MSNNDLLTPNLKRPLDRTALGNDVAVINSLVGFLNSPLVAEAELGKGETSAAEAMASTTPRADEQAAQVAANPTLKARQTPTPVVQPVVPVAVSSSIDFSKIFYTGRLCAGKDHVAKQTGAVVESFAAPLYKLATQLFGVEVTADKNKDLPGVRAFLQTVGQWGKGVVSEQYPLTVVRGLFVDHIRQFPNDDGTMVDWVTYGNNQNIWLDAAVRRVEAAGAPRVAITNVRFGFEFKYLQEQGWTNFHVITSLDEWKARLAARKLTPESPVMKDVSEQLAAKLDAQVMAELSAHRTGPKLRVIWNSDKPVPSGRLWTVSEFLSSGAPSETIPYLGE